MTPGPDPKALLADATGLDAAWDSWIQADSSDEAFAAVEAAMANIRAVLSGSRRLRSHTDIYGYLRVRCQCGWAGSPWTDGNPMAGNFATARQQAHGEFARHECYPSEEVA